MTPSESRIPTPFTFSQSSLQDYADCPRRFYLRYIERMVWPAVESEPAAEFERRQQDGLLFHRLVQQRSLGVPLEKLAALATGSNLKRWWQNYMATDLGIGEHAQFAEITLSCPIAEHRLLAKFDLVAIRNGQALIVDWKTYARRPTDEWLAARWQTRVYRAVLAHAGDQMNENQELRPEQIRLMYWFADYPSDPAVFDYDAQQLGRDWSALDTLVREISSAQAFPLTDDLNMCRYCVFRSYCNRGQRAGDWRESDGEQDAQASFDVNYDQIAEIEF